MTLFVTLGLIWGGLSMLLLFALARQSLGKWQLGLTVREVTPSRTPVTYWTMIAVLAICWLYVGARAAQATVEALT